MAFSRKETADDALREINENLIKLNDEDIKQSNQIIDWLKFDVVNEMKKDQLFNLLFREIYYSGSFYDGLKIENPNEFDLNFVMDTSKFEHITTLVEGSPGYFKMKLQKPENESRRKILGERFWSLTQGNRCDKGFVSSN